MDVKSGAALDPLAVDLGVCLKERRAFEQGQTGGFHVHGDS